MKEELRDDEIGAAIDFLLQVDQIVLVRFRVRMALRIAYEETRRTSRRLISKQAMWPTGDANDEIVVEILANESDQIRCVSKVALLRIPFFANGWI